MIEARKKGSHTKQEWHEMKLYFRCCVRCGTKNLNLVKDHIVPVYQGGSDSIKNLQPLCVKCNSSKGPNNTDLRLSFCKNNNLYMPKDWI